METPRLIPGDVLTVGSLFTGIGGIELGLEWTGGFKTVWQVENDDYATRVLEKHWPDVRRWRDVRDFPPEPIDEWRCDLICGGFPCQDISYAGKGAGLDGERSGLWWEFARVVRTLEPRYVLVENVAALLIRGLDAVLGTLASLGYDAEWHCIPAAAVGAPHIRDRVFIIGTQYSDANSGWNVQRECKPEHERAGVSRAFCQDVPDTSQQLGNTSDGQGSRQGRFTPGGCGGVNWSPWSTEPDVGRVASRLSSWLDGGVNAHESCITEASATSVPETEAVRTMRQFRGETEPSSLQSSKCLVCGSAMHEMPRQDRPKAGQRADPKGEAMCDLWARVQQLYAQSSEDVRQALSRRSGQTERLEAVASRVDRLRCLGNAVVPQVSQWLGERILEHENMQQMRSAEDAD